MDNSFNSPRALLLLVVLYALAQWNIASAKKRQFTDVHQRRMLFHTILSCGLIGACFGALMDQVTVTLSPHYFSVFKDLPAESAMELRLRAGDLGFAAGLVPGLITGFCLGVAAAMGIEPKSPEHGKLPLRYLLIPAGLISLFAPILAWYQVNWDPGGYRSSLHALVNADESRNLVAVWGVHQAAYLGGFLGTVIATIKLRRDVERRELVKSALEAS